MGFFRKVLRIWFWGGSLLARGVLCFGAVRRLPAPGTTSASGSYLRPFMPPVLTLQPDLQPQDWLPRPAFANGRRGQNPAQRLQLASRGLTRRPYPLQLQPLVCYRPPAPDGREQCRATIKACPKRGRNRFNMTFLPASWSTTAVRNKSEAIEKRRGHNKE